MENKLVSWFWYFHKKNICNMKLRFIHWFFDLNPAKHCWADCVSWAFSPDQFNPFKIENCKGCETESKDDGMCYCGGWKNGVCWHTLSKEEQAKIRAEEYLSQDKPF